jgi:hypothetical protein
VQNFSHPASCLRWSYSGSLVPPHVNFSASVFCWLFLSYMPTDGSQLCHQTYVQIYVVISRTFTHALKQFIRLPLYISKFQNRQSLSIQTLLLARSRKWPLSLAQLRLRASRRRTSDRRSADTRTCGNKETRTRARTGTRERRGPGYGGRPEGRTVTVEICADGSFRTA